jgi:alkaline phosphatase
LAYTNGPGFRATGRPDLTNVDTTDVNFLQEATVPMASETHAGEDVAIYARGPKAHLVRGSMEQNWIYHVMMEALK